MARIIKFPGQYRRAPPPASSSPVPAASAQLKDQTGIDWLGVLICGLIGALVLPLVMIGVLLWPIVKLLLGAYAIGILIAMLFGGTKWLLIGLAHFAFLGALLFLFSSGDGK
jgi:hypothetical protein